MFGRSLESHLKQTGREVSTVIEDCIGVLYQEALDEEVNFDVTCYGRPME